MHFLSKFFFCFDVLYQISEQGVSSVNQIVLSLKIKWKKILGTSEKI